MLGVHYNRINCRSSKVAKAATDCPGKVRDFMYKKHCSNNCEEVKVVEHRGEDTRAGGWKTGVCKKCTAYSEENGNAIRVRSCDAQPKKTLGIKKKNVGPILSGRGSRSAVVTKWKKKILGAA